MSQTVDRPVLRFDSPLQQAYLSIWRTYDRLRVVEDELFGKFEITNQQYNVLRLLRSEHPVAVPVSRLWERLVSRGPDVTRMLDRLESKGWISRSRSLEDRRAVLSTITEEGTALLERIHPRLMECHERQLGHLRVRELETLVDLLRKARAPHEPEDSVWR